MRYKLSLFIAILIASTAPALTAHADGIFVATLPPVITFRNDRDTSYWSNYGFPEFSRGKQITRVVYDVRYQPTREDVRIKVCLERLGKDDLCTKEFSPTSDYSSVDTEKFIGENPAGPWKIVAGIGRESRYRSFMRPELYPNGNSWLGVEWK